MPEISFFLKGIIIGFSIAAPVGPIGVLCIKRTLNEGRVYGLVSGLGAATADAIYGSIGGFGLTFISNFLIDQQDWIRIIGGIFLCYLGVKTFLTKPASQVSISNGYGRAKAYASAFLLTITNPITILSFAAIFAGLGLGSLNKNYISAAMLIAGVFTGSALWWFVLSTGISVFRGKFDQRRLQWTNRASAVILVSFGIFAFLSLI